MKKQNDKILKSKNNLKITTHRYIFLPISLLLKGLIKTKTNHKTSFLQVLIVCYPSLFFYCKYTVPLGETCPSCQGLLSRGEPSLISVKIILTYPIENLALMFAKQLHWRYWLRMSFVLWLHKMIKYFHLLIQVISFPIIQLSVDFIVHEDSSVLGKHGLRLTEKKLTLQQWE